jgi:formyltetrahydrofolate synthetase
MGLEAAIIEIKSSVVMFCNRINEIDVDADMNYVVAQISSLNTIIGLLRPPANNKLHVLESCLES